MGKFVEDFRSPQREERYRGCCSWVGDVGLGRSRLTPEMFFLKQQKNIGPFLGNSMNPNDGVDLGGRVTFTSMNGCFCFFFLRGVNVGKYTSRMDPMLGCPR